MGPPRIRSRAALYRCPERAESAKILVPFENIFLRVLKSRQNRRHALTLLLTITTLRRAIFFAPMMNSHRRTPQDTKKSLPIITLRVLRRPAVANNLQAFGNLYKIPGAVAPSLVLSLIFYP